MTSTHLVGSSIFLGFRPDEAVKKGYGRLIRDAEDPPADIDMADQFFGHRQANRPSPIQIPVHTCSRQSMTCNPE